MKRAIAAMLCVIAAAALLSPGALAVEPGAGLDALIADARAVNPDIRAAQKRWEAARARVPQAKSLDNPSLGLRVEKVPRGTVKFDRTGAQDRMLEIGQLLPLAGKLSLKGKLALVDAQIAAAQYKAKELEVVADLSAAYYDLFMNYAEEELNREALTWIEAAAALARARYVSGEVTQQSLLKLQVEAARTGTRIRNSGEERRALAARVNSLLNRPLDAGLERPVLCEALAFAEPIEELSRRTLQNQPELLTFAYAIEKNRHAVSLARRSIIPDVMAGIVQRGIFSGGLGSWDLALSFTVPLWFWTKQRYEIREAISNREEAEAAYEAMRNKALSETRALAARIEIARNKAALYKSDVLPLLEGAVDASLAGFRSGTADSMALLDNVRMLIESRMDYYRALVEYHQALARLRQQTGERALEEVSR